MSSCKNMVLLGKNEEKERRLPYPSIISIYVWFAL
jgi:hypothetical protein